jgi:hypothetical protein
MTKIASLCATVALLGLFCGCTPTRQVAQAAGNIQSLSHATDHFIDQGQPQVAKTLQQGVRAEAAGIVAATAPDEPPTITPKQAIEAPQQATQDAATHGAAVAQAGSKWTTAKAVTWSILGALGSIAGVVLAFKTGGAIQAGFLAVKAVRQIVAGVQEARSTVHPDSRALLDQALKAAADDDVKALVQKIKDRNKIPSVTDKGG